MCLYGCKEFVTSTQSKNVVYIYFIHNYTENGSNPEDLTTGMNAKATTGN